MRDFLSEAKSLGVEFEDEKFLRRLSDLQELLFETRGWRAIQHEAGEHVTVEDKDNCGAGGGNRGVAREAPMKKMVFKRVSMTLDLATAQKCRELASQKGQSVSSFVRYLVVEAYAREAAMTTKGAEQRREKC